VEITTLLVRGSRSYGVKCVEIMSACDTKVRGKSEICERCVDTHGRGA
jgi:hypothetical protein